MLPESTEHPRLSFEKGTIRINGAELLQIPDAKYDERSKSLRAYGMHYTRIVEYLQESDIGFTDNVSDFIPMPTTLHARNLVLRSYQQDAISKWNRTSKRGCIILPTGSGKTAVGIQAILEACTPTLVVVPTIDLMEQWVRSLSGHLAIDGASSGQQDEHNTVKIPEIGRLGGGEDVLHAVTVATYDSAYIRAPSIGNRFGLLVFDEVHHLPAPGYRSIAEQSMAPFRLGLTATMEREDGLHRLLPTLVGGIVFRKGAEELAEQKHLAKHTIHQVRVNLLPEEQLEYDKCRTEFLAGMKSLGMTSESMYNLKKLIMISNRSRKARETLLARNRANEIALNSGAKINQLQMILKSECTGTNHHNNDNTKKKTIIFTQNNKMAYVIADKFLIPIITHKTARTERREVLDGFRTGRYIAVVTSKVLDEGVDVPDAELGIIVSGTGSGREMIQRLGRLLRPKRDGNSAKLIEIVSSKTRETGSSAKRVAALRRNSTSRTQRRGGA